MINTANYINKLKRKVLIAEDEFLNQQILAKILGDEYEILFAEDGVKALNTIRAEQKTLSIILLDLRMPKMDGYELLKTLSADKSLKRIPVIVLTSEKEAEVESLSLGAADFIQKPYQAPEVIRARVKRTIEFAEDNELISSNELDSLTGLYNKEFFFGYCDKLDRYDDRLMDALYINLHKFQTINELYGHDYGNEVLKNLATIIKNYLSGHGGLAARDNEDFLVYVNHIDSYQSFLNYVTEQLKSLRYAANVSLRMGVYVCEDKSTHPQMRFDRANFACENVKSTLIADFLVYDETMLKKEILHEKLINDFDKAVAEKEFEVYYQPKFRIADEDVVLASAEALIRWKHKDLGMISPGVFIPLFEDNGLIEQLDAFVWEQAAAQIKDWRDRLNRRIPVSVNVSRVDILNPNLKDRFLELLDKYDLSFDDLILEITESAYTNDSKQIVSVVKGLRDAGFVVVMDDFGSGYSSLNMIASMPLDALKIDMVFIRNMFNSSADFRMVQFVIDISRFLKIPVVAEGVETEEQFNSLKLLGCDIIQGYYFSKPLPAADFELFIQTQK